MMNLPHSNGADGVEADESARKEHLMVELGGVHRSLEHAERELGKLTLENAQLTREVKRLRGENDWLTKRLRNAPQPKRPRLTEELMMSIQEPHLHGSSTGTCICPSPDRSECVYLEVAEDGKDVAHIDGDCPCSCHDEFDAFALSEAADFDERMGGLPATPEESLPPINGNTGR